MLLLLFLVIPATAQHFCMDLLRDCYAKLKEAPYLKELAEGEAYYLRFTVRTVPEDSLRHPPTETEMKVWIGPERVRYESQPATVYHDNKHSVRVYPEQQRVTLADGIPLSQKRTLAREGHPFGGKAAEVRERLMANAILTDCRRLRGTANRYIALQLFADSARTRPAGRMTFLVDGRTEQIKRVTRHYRNHHQDIAYVQYDFHEMQYRKKTDKLDKPVIREIMDAKGELLPRYADYIFNDVRVKEVKP